MAPRISIYSEEQGERRKDASLHDAAAVLKGVENGSSVYVYIVFHHEIKLPDLIALLDILKDNGLFDVRCVVSEDSDFGKKELKEKLRIMKQATRGLVRRRSSCSR